MKKHLPTIYIISRETTVISDNAYSMDSDLELIYSIMLYFRKIAVSRQWNFQESIGEWNLVTN